MRERLAIRASQLQVGDICAGSGAIVLERYQSVDVGRVALKVSYPGSNTVRHASWNKSTTLVVLRDSVGSD